MSATESKSIPVKGKYHYRLRGILLFLLLIAIILLSIFYASLTHKNYSHDWRVQQQQNAWYERNAFTTRNDLLLKEMQSLATDPAIIRFADRNLSYSYATVAAYQKLIQFSTLFSSDTYELAVTSSWEDAKVLTTDGSLDKALYFSQTLRLSAEQTSAIEEFLSSSSGYQLNLPIYNADGDLQEIIRVDRRSANVNAIYFICRLTPGFFVENPINNAYLIYDSSGAEFARSTLEPIASRQTTEEITRLVNDDNQRSSPTDGVTVTGPSKESILLYNLPQTNLTMAVIAEADINVWYFRIFGLILFLPFAIAGALFLSRLLSRTLYKPIEVVMTSFETETDTQEKRRVDELALINSRIETFRNIRSELEEITRENIRFQDQEVLLALFNGTEPFDKGLPLMDELENFQIITLMFEEDDPEELVLLHRQLILLSSSVSNVRSLAIEPNRFVFVFLSDKRSEVEETFLSFLSDLQKLPDWYAAISRTGHGPKEVQPALLECIELLEYRYQTAVNTILDSENLPADRSAFYFYSMETEHLLSRLIVSSNSEALAVFDKIIRENFEIRQLADDAVEELLLALTNTIRRCLQELKLDPVKLVSVPHNALDTIEENWHNPSVITDLRAFVEAMLLYTKHSDDSQEQQQLEKMQFFIAQNYKDDIMLQDLSEYMGFHPKYCSALFARLASTNFKEYLNTYRIRQAIKLLKKQPDIKIADLAGEVGFNSASSFIRVFKQLTGTTPGRYH